MAMYSVVKISGRIEMKKTRSPLKERAAFLGKCKLHYS